MGALTQHSQAGTKPAGHRWCQSVAASLREVGPLALILRSDTGRPANDPAQFSDKVNLITVPMLPSLHMTAAGEGFDAFRFN